MPDSPVSFKELLTLQGTDQTTTVQAQINTLSSQMVGASGTFTSADAKTITVVNGRITSIV